jgi:prophage DNA circulation protein
MSWTRGYLQAKLGGVPFFVQRSLVKGGRRNVKHIYPRRDSIDHEDMGSDDKTFKLDGYVLGDDYFQQRNDLEEVLDRGGDLILTHPYRGTVTVVVDKWRCVEVTDEGRLARFTMSFSRQGDEEMTRVSPNTKNKVLSLKHSYLANILQWFESVYDLASRPASAIADARETIDKGLQVIDAAKRTAGSVAEFKRQIQNARGDVIALSLNVQYLGQTFTGLIDFGTEDGNGIDFGVTEDDALDQTREQRQIAASTETPLVNTSEDIAQDEAYPAYQVQKLMRLTALASSIGLIVEIPFETVVDAEDIQEELFAQIDAELSDPNITDEMYIDLRDAKEAVFNNLQEQVISLPLVVEYTPTQQTNSLALSQSLYGDVEEESDIIRRNSLVHPGFVPAAVALKVKVRNE